MAAISGIAEKVALTLSPYLGDFNAKIWVKTVVEKKLGRTVAELRAEDLGPLLEGLRPAVRTMMGREAADELITRIQREVR